MEGAKDYYTELEMASILGWKKSTLQKNRSLRKKHPPYRKIGRVVQYPKKDADTWIKRFPIFTELKHD